MPAINYPDPKTTVRGLRALFPNAKFLQDVVVTVVNNVVTSVKAPRPVTPEEIEAAAAAAPVVVPARTLSKLTITRRLRELGKEDDFWAILTAQPVLYREFILAQELRTDDAMFTVQAPQLKAALNLTNDQFNALLAP